LFSFPTRNQKPFEMGNLFKYPVILQTPSQKEKNNPPVLLTVMIDENIFQPTFEAG